MASIATIVVIFIITKRKMLQIDKKPEILQKYGFLVEEFTFYRTTTRIYYVIFFIRRFLFAVILCFPFNLQLGQIALNLVINILVIFLL